VARPTRTDVEDFLFEEAALLDAWRLDEWLELFTEDAVYAVPATNLPGSDVRQTLPAINDDFARIKGRVERLKSRHAHREFPWSRTRRLIANVRLLDTRDDETDIAANFIVVRCRNELVDQVSGCYFYTLVHGRGLKIRRRRAELDMEAIGTRGSISFIL
jgi:p-cumate 2,3-dioxygenase beta subunit